MAVALPPAFAQRPLVLPLVVGPAPSPASSQQPQPAFPPTALATWASADVPGQAQRSGLAVGSADGSVYLFRSSPPSHARPASSAAPSSPLPAGSPSSSFRPPQPPLLSRTSTSDDPSHLGVRRASSPGGTTTPNRHRATSSSSSASRAPSAGGTSAGQPPLPGGSTYRSSRLASISSISTLQAAPPVLTGVDETVAERAEDLRELLSSSSGSARDGAADGADAHPFSASSTAAGSRRPSRPPSVASHKRDPLPPSITAPSSPPVPGSPSSAAAAAAAVAALPFVALPHSPLSDATRRSFSLSQTYLPHLALPPTLSSPPIFAKVAEGDVPASWDDGHLRVWPPRASATNPVVGLTGGVTGTPLLVLSLQGTISLVSATDGTVLRSTSLSSLSPSLANLQWTSAVALPPSPGSATPSHTVLLGRPGPNAQPAGPSRAVLLDTASLALVGAGLEIAGRAAALELVGRHPTTAAAATATTGDKVVELLALAEEPDSVVRLTLSFAVPQPPDAPTHSSSPADAHLSPPLGPADHAPFQSSSRPVDALRDFFHRGLARSPDAPLVPPADAADARALTVQWEGKTVALAEVADGLSASGLGEVRGVRALGADGERVLVWADEGLVAYDLSPAGSTLVLREHLGLLAVGPPRADGSLVLSTAEGDIVFRVEETDVNGDAPSRGSKTVYSGKLAPLASSGASAAAVILHPFPSGALLKLAASTSGLALSCLPANLSSDAVQSLSVPFDDAQAEAVTSLASAGEQAVGEVFVGTSLGRVLRLPLTAVGQSVFALDAASEPILDGRVTALAHAFDPPTGRFYLGAGDDNGGFAVLDPATTEPLAHWTLFASPVSQVLLLDTLGPTRHACALVLSADGALAAVDLKLLRPLFTIPATRAPLTHAFLSDSLLMLIDSAAHARQWDLATLELRRSLGAAQALASARDDGWEALPLLGAAEETGGPTVKEVLRPAGLEADDEALALRLDIAALLSSSSPSKSPADALVQAKAHAAPSGLGGVLAALLGWGLDGEIDARAEEGLQVVRPATAGGGLVPGVQSLGRSCTVANTPRPAAQWEVSPAQTGTRLLGLISVLQLYLAIESMESAASEIISFYATRLPEVVGEAYQPASLAFYSDYWLHSAPEIQQAARVLFGATLARTPDKALVAIVESLQHELPSCQPEGQRNSDAAARALILIGQIVVENYSLFSTGLLKDVAHSITAYLDDGGSPFRALGVDLCSAGFQIWQHYVDAMEVLRSLFHLATAKAAAGGLTLQARNASFHVASTNTPLFMTTLSYDIINAASPDQRNATMKLVALLAKRKPLILYSSLPRILEAVVKSLDPNVTAMRDTVHSTATVILESLVNSFPSVAFHGKSQKLGVGTLEGAVIVYDLKTATRLYVLEGHKHKITACSFSPDGRRLVTVSLEESKVVIWKTGMSFTSLFNVGVPPRQGGPAPGEPFKTYDFHIGDEGNMTTLASLEWVRFEWPGERSARLRVRETALTFAT